MADSASTTVSTHSNRAIWVLVGVGVLVAALLVVVLVILLSGGARGGDDSAVKETFTVSGSLELIGDVDGTTSECWGAGGYDDLGEGTQVVVRDNSGATVGIGSLDAGVVPKAFDLDSSTIIACAWTFTVDDVPSGSSSYSVEVSHRGEIAFTEEQADSVALSLG